MNYHFRKSPFSAHKKAPFQKKDALKKQYARFITLRNCTTLKHNSTRINDAHRFITVKNYITLKPMACRNSESSKFITIRNYFTLKHEKSS